MLMIVPLMIWSALTEIDSQAWTSETRRRAGPPATSATSSAGVMPKTGPPVEPRSGHEEGARRPADEGGDEHRPLDADVDDAGALAHDAAQRGERDRHGACRMIGAMTGRIAMR